MALIASGGNSKSWSSNGWPDVITPSSGYNSIAVGAYTASGDHDNDRMKDYRYNSIEGTDRVNYKPDVVVAAPSTSEAAPALSGITAMMIQLKPSLAANPELIKAILMASCHRKVLPASGTPQEDIADGLTQRQGAGAIDAYRAISIIASEHYGVSSISTGSTDINLGQPGISNESINVSLAWLRKNTYVSSDLGSSTLGTLQELELCAMNNSQILGTSAKTNAGKQMLYFPASPQNLTIRVTKTSQNTEPVRYAYAWSIENATLKIEYELTAAATDLKFENSSFYYTSIRFSDNRKLLNNRNIYVVIKKHTSSGDENISPIYTVAMDASSAGSIPYVATSVRNFAENEYIEILIYSDSTKQNLISQQFFHPVVFDFNG